MNSQIFGVLNAQTTPNLFQRLQRLDLEQKESQGLGIAALMDGRIQQLQIRGNWSDLQTLQQRRTFQGRFGVAFTRQMASQSNPEEKSYQTRLDANQNLVLVHHGFIENSYEIKNELFDLGYEFSLETDNQIIFYMIKRYLDIGLRPDEALKVCMMRLEGEFAIIGLFREPKELLIGARRRLSLAIGVADNVFYISSNTEALSLICNQVIQIQAGEPVVLNSLQTITHDKALTYPSYPPL
jgi:glutamine---fructose-6-phosphate transaminase (isomerizing)